MFEYITGIFLFDYTSKNLFEYYNVKTNESYSNTILKLLTNNKSILERLNKKEDELTDIDLLKQIECGFNDSRNNKYKVKKIKQESYSPQLNLLKRVNNRTIYELNTIYVYSFMLNNNLKEGYLKLTNINLTDENDFVIYYKVENIEPKITEIKHFIEELVTTSSDLQILPKLLTITTKQFSPDYNTWDNLTKKIPQLKQLNKDIINYDIPSEDEIQKRLSKMQKKIGLNENKSLDKKIFSDLVYQLQIGVLEDIQSK